MNDVIHVRILVVGDDGVGKNTLVSSICSESHADQSSSRPQVPATNPSSSPMSLFQTNGVSVLDQAKRISLSSKNRILESYASFTASSSSSSSSSSPSNTSEDSALNPSSSSPQGCQISLKVEHYQGKTIALSFWVLNPSPKFTHSRNFWLHVSKYDAVLIVYDLTWATSRDNIRRIWLPLITEHEQYFDEEDNGQSVAGMIAKRSYYFYSGKEMVVKRSRKEDGYDSMVESASEASDHESSRRKKRGSLLALVIYRFFKTLWLFMVRLVNLEQIYSYIEAIEDGILSVCRVVLSYVLSGDDLLNRAEERRLLSMLHTRCAIVGTRLDLLKAQRSLLPTSQQDGSQQQQQSQYNILTHGCLTIQLDSSKAAEHMKLTTFVRSLVEKKIKAASAGDASVAAMSKTVV